jgi:hypothetical protein
VTPETLLARYRTLIAKQCRSTRRDPGDRTAPERVKKTTWTEFLKTHCDVLAATDFFTIDVGTGRGLTRFPAA